MLGTRIVREIISWTKTIVIAVGLAFFFNAFILQGYEVKGESMLPTLQDHDSTYVFKLGHSYDYENIVIIDSRVNQQRTYKDDLADHAFITKLTGKKIDYLWIKRVIGKAGDTIELKDGQLYRNGELLQESYILEQDIRTPDQTWIIPENHLFVMGDNRNDSRDSRDIGSVPIANVLGKVILK